MAQRFTKFKSNYLMRSQHQQTDLGRVMERDWPTTNGLNVLRFGSGRRTWYNSGTFVFTTSNVPTYHKKHKLTTEIKEWMWDDVKTADGTVNSVMPSFNSIDVRDYAYYGSCVELIRATIEEIIGDFPGRLVSTFNRPSTDIRINEVDEIPSYEPTEGDVSYDNDIWFVYNGTQWVELKQLDNETQGRSLLGKENGTEIGGIYYVKSTEEVMQMLLNEQTNTPYFESYGALSGYFEAVYFVQNRGEYYKYSHTFNSNKGEFIGISPIDVVDGYEVSNPFNIDLHHRQVKLGDYDNAMRFMSLSWKKYCIIVNSEDTDNIVSFNIDDEEIDKVCLANNEGRIIKTITFTTESGKEYVIKAYYLNGEVIYTYMPEGSETIKIQPQEEYITEYFASLSGFKKQLLRQDTKPLYTNTFRTPVETDFVWNYPQKRYTWPSTDYCISVDGLGFESYVERLYDMAQNFDDMWTDNLYRSMTHEAIKNFDWTYSRDYYEGDEQDNIDGGERMQKIIRVMGRCFDDIKHYIDNIKLVHAVTYNRIKNGPEALLSDENNIKGFDLVSTISSDYDIDATITSDFLYDVSKDTAWIDESESTLPKWYPTRYSKDVYADVCDNEFMRRLSLSAKHILSAKGTQHSIEMIMGLFGFGRGVDYEIEEECYYTEKMIRYDECVNGETDSIGITGDDWRTLGGVDWSEITIPKKGDIATYINQNADHDLLYDDDPLSGIPMRTVMLGRENTQYLVPYYDNSQLYNNNLIFQGKGGWGKFIKKGDNDYLDDQFDYQETLSYLHVAGTVGELLSLNYNLLSVNDIYYVVNLGDYTDYDENPPMDTEIGITMSHYFILTDLMYANNIIGWKNIVVKPELEDGQLQMIDDVDVFQYAFGKDGSQEWAYSPEYLDNLAYATDDEKLSTYVYAFAKMHYLDNLFSTNVGNNPHVGYGIYDDGQSFIEHMKLPFKYLIDEMKIGSYSLHSLAKLYSFDDIGDDTRVVDKIQIMNTRQTDEENVKTDFVSYDADDTSITRTYTRGEDEYNNEKRWYINTKTLTITYIKTNSKGEIDLNSMFTNYFKSIVLPYLMQVIPSTTILKLKNFTE